MKVAITVKGLGLGCQLEPRFGRAEHFVIVETEYGQCELFDNTRNSRANSGAGVQTSQQILDLGVAAVITGHVGPKALQVLQAGGVDVYTRVGGTA